MSFHHFFSEKTLHVNASTDTTSSNQENKDISGSVSMTMYGGGSGMGATLGYGQSHESSDSTTNHNANLIAKNIDITTTNDASFKGATVQADDTLNVKVGGDLSVESVRDSSSSNSKGFNVSVSGSLGNDEKYTAKEKNYDTKQEYYNAQDKLNNTVGARIGDGLGSTGASYGANAGNSQSKQTVLTSLTGDKVNIEVENNTNVKGALIAAGKIDEQGTFQDNGNLNLSTGTLTFANSTNSQYSSSNSYSVGTNIGYTTGKNTQTNVEETTGKVNSSSLSLSNEMGYSSSKTLATVGEGTLHVKDTENSDDLQRLNRDTSKVSKELYSGSVSTSVTAVLDHRLLTEDGWKLIAQDFVKTGMMLDTINQVVSNQTVGLSSFGEELRKREIAYETVKERIAQDKDLAAILNSPAYTDAQKDAIINGITQQVMVELGYKPVDTVLIATLEPGRDGYQVKGYYSLETGKAYINDFYNNSNYDLLTTAGTEAQRAIDAQDGSTFDQSQEYRDARSAYAQNFGSNIASYADFALYFTGQGSISTGANSISTTTQTQNNNAEFAGLNKELGDNLIWSQLSKDRAVFSSPFGIRTLPGQPARLHNGTDITYKDANGNKITNAIIFAAGDGIVLESGNAGQRNGNGNYIRIYHPDTGYTSEYLHASELLVKKGEIVQEGQPIIVEGGSGNKGSESYPKHLHFGIMQGEGYDVTKYINPAPTNGDQPVNVGKYEKLEDTPYQQGLKK